MPDYLDELLREGKLDSLEKPSSARVYDFLLDGTHNYAIDREFAKDLLSAMPDAARVAQANRAFAGRAIRYALASGITQFVDIGSGLPSQGQAHEIADEADPEARVRVVYVDNEPIAHAHAEILLSREADPARHKAVTADFHDPDVLWSKVAATRLIRPDEPTAVLVTSILHFMPPETRPEATMALYRDRLAPGSQLILTHCGEENDDPGYRAATRSYQQATDQVNLRTREEFAVFFGDWTLVEPGLCWTVEWRPAGKEDAWWEGEPARASLLAGVAVKP
jgi:O-methyltransferase involved in polyketide biosynthesis